MKTEPKIKRLTEKTTLHAIQVELQQGYNLSPVEAQVLARRVQQLVDEQIGRARQPGQITYQAIAVEEPPGKPLNKCRKVPVHLSLIEEGDGQVWATEGSKGLRRLRVHRLIYEALLQGGALSQEDVACILGVSRKTVQRLFAYFREHEQPLPSRGEIQDMGRGVSHKIPVIGKYVQDLSFWRISLELNKHGVGSMARYLRHFALVMILEERGLSPAQMQSVIGISQNLIEQYRALYVELNVPQHARTLERLRQTAFPSSGEADRSSEQPKALPVEGEKGGP
jgi:DNA-binding CsgD family transcriptional regulator